MRQITYTLATIAALALLASSCKKNEYKTTTPTPTPTETVSDTVNIGALLSLTGNWSSLGITSKAAIDIALEDINAYMSQGGTKRRFKATIYDTKLDAALASQYITDAGKKGCTFVLGPQSSAEADAVKAYANTHNMLVVSQGSTAGSLSIDNDNLFRFCPADHIEGLAMAKTLNKDGIRGLVTAARDDAGNRGLQTATGNAFEALGGNVEATNPYSNAANVNFTPLLADIKAGIEQYKQAFPTNQIAVYLASFDECVALFEQAANDPVLSSVRWYGGDGTALSVAITANTAAADFAIATQYFAPAFGLPAQAAAKWQPLSNQIKNRTGIAPDAFALATYDALWVMALSYNAQGSTMPDFVKLKTEFVAQAGRYYGATGTTMLNAAGDRAVGSYDYWGITKDGNNYKWVVVGQSE